MALFQLGARAPSNRAKCLKPIKLKSMTLISSPYSTMFLIERTKFPSQYCQVLLLNFLLILLKKQPKTQILAHWSKDKIFIRVYPCELCMPNQFKNRNPEIPRVMDKLGASHSAMEEEVRRAREKWRKELKKECEILLEGKSVKSGRWSLQY